MRDAGRLLGPGGQDIWFRRTGRAVGSIVLAGFGAYSMYGWTVAVVQSGKQIWFAAIAAVTSVLVIWAIAQLAFLRHAQKPAVEKRVQRHYRLGFLIILAMEVSAILIGGPILSRFHRVDLVPEWVCVIVGIHFFPLGKLFKLPLYYLTGLAILLSATGSLLLPPSPLRLAVNAGGTALALWLTSSVTLSKNLSPFSPEPDSTPVSREEPSSNPTCSGRSIAGI